MTELVLVDPDEHQLGRVDGVSARIMAAYDHPATVRVTTNLDEGLDGAGAVLPQLRIGGRAARHRDETWPLACGCVGQETTGAGGFAEALRTVPIVLDIAASPPGSARNARLSNGIAQRVHARAPAVRVGVVDVPPIAGAALLGLDHLGLGRDAQDRLRAAYVNVDASTGLGVTLG